MPPTLRVAVPVPLRGILEYLPPEGLAAANCPPGIRVRVPFGSKTRIGVVLGIECHSTIDGKRLRRVLEVIDESPLLDSDLLAFLVWASDYFHYPLGEVVVGTLPVALRKGRPVSSVKSQSWRLTKNGEDSDPESWARAPRQAQLLKMFQGNGGELQARQLELVGYDWQRPLRRLLELNLVEPCVRERTEEIVQVARTYTLNAAQSNVVAAVAASGDRFATFLLDGVTGSGKTAVYTALIEQALAAGKQALVLIPEIGLTPQIAANFQRQLAAPVAILHSGLGDAERLRAWSAARRGDAAVIIGTRSAVFVPLPRPGLLIVDEEHDLSYKQQDGFRYSARDLAVVRARQLKIPLVLGSATPSLESLSNAQLGRYQHLKLPLRAGDAQEPILEVIDLRARPFEDGLSQPLVQAIEAVIARGEQTLLFLNRRGYAPVLMCHACGWHVDCLRCDAHMIYHRHDRCVRCHHCGSQGPVPTLCLVCESADVRALGLGTQRVASALQQIFPKTRIDRIDRDSTRNKGALGKVLAAIHSGQTQILVGTQMLAKGHHFPNVTLVGILDADSGLFGADFRSAERMAQLLVQVAGRAGRGLQQGRVLIQTHHPDHPLLRTLLQHGYAEFSKAALDERRRALLPPWSSMTLLRAEATSPAAVMSFLSEASRQASRQSGSKHIRILGPVPAAMERKAGRYRAQLLIESEHRATIQRFLGDWIAALSNLKLSRRVRWSVDVDPQEMN